MILAICRTIKRELAQWRDTMSYIDIMVFVGCVVAALLESRLINEDENRTIRRELDLK